MTVKKLSDIKNVLYINLDSRTDRRQQVETELKELGIEHFSRFAAIKKDQGSLGCSLSHLRCLQLAKNSGWDHVLIVEDDIQFLDKDLFVSQLNGFLATDTPWDVVLFSGNNQGIFKKVNPYSVQVKYCQTTTGYLVSSHYFDKLIKNISDGIKLLLLFPNNVLLYTIDQFWKILQQTDSWFLIIPLTVIQRYGYSDIEKKTVNYSNMMTTLY
jgi:glycosyl transferase family 25